MKSSLKICSILFLSLMNCAAQKVTITDLGYVLLKEDEETIRQHSQEQGKYVIEVLTPRRYVNKPRTLQVNHFSDIILFYDPITSSSVEIYILNDDLKSDEFQNFINNLQTHVNVEYFSKNLKIEGFEIIVKKILSSLAECSLEIKVTSDDHFTPGIDDDLWELELIANGDDYTTIKIEIFSKIRAEAVFTQIMDTRALKDSKFRWDGKIIAQDSEYIRSTDAPLTVRVSLSKDSEFRSFITESVTIEIDKTVDEWNDYKRFFDGYVVKDDFPSSKYQFYKEELREAMKRSIPSEHLPEDKSPLQYMHENLTTITFLGKSIVTHRKFAEKLLSVEATLATQGDNTELTGVYNKLVNGSFALRKIKNRNSMSPHSLAAAIDIDPDRNPHIKDTWGEQVFSVINFVTNVNMYNSQPTVEQMKVANKTFKKNFNDLYIRKIEVLSKFTEADIEAIDNKLKFQGEFDGTLQYLYERISQTFDSYLKVTPGVTDEERRRETEYLDMIKGLKIQVALHEKSVSDFLASIPSFDFIPDLHAKFNRDKEILLNKINMLLYFNPSSNYLADNTRHKENCKADIKSLFDKVKLQEMAYALDLMSNQRSLLMNMSTKGFFELDERIVNAFFAESNTRWGGNYQREKDFMHFELYPLTSSLK